MPHFNNYSNRSTTNFVTDKVNMMLPQSPSSLQLLEHLKLD